MAEIIKVENEFLGEKYYVTKHKSGLEIYVFPKKLTKYYALFATRYGAIDNAFKLEGEDEFTRVPDGIAHFLEHKMFENEDGVDTFERYAKFGASANAYTSNTMTAYLFSCTEHFYNSLEILLDFVTHPYFTPETVQKEQGIIGQEIRMYEDNPGNRLFMGLMEAMYEKNNMRIDIAGTVESISEITADILYKCYNTFYDLSNMALAVSGDVDVDKVLEVADKILKVCNAQKIIRCYPEGEKAEVFKKRYSANLQVAKPMFMIGVKDIDISSDPKIRQWKSAAVNILDSMLFSRSGAFYNELYDQGLISPNLGYGYDHAKTYSFNIISGEADNPELIYDRFVKYIDDKKQNGLDRDAFERCKRVAYAANVCSYENTDYIANMLINNVFEETDMFGYTDIISSITFEDVTELLNKIFKEEYYTMSVVNPIETK